MRMAWVVMMVTVLVATLFAVPGCQPWSPEARMLAARESFNATVNVLSGAIEAGEFSKVEIDQILMLARLGRDAIDRYEAALEVGESPSEFIRQMKLIIRELVAYRLKADRREQKDLDLKLDGRLKGGPD